MNQSLPPGVAERPPPETFISGVGQEVFLQASRRLRRTVGFDAAGWFATDPLTLLPTSPMLLENAAAGLCEIYWGQEFDDNDVLLFRDLALAPRPAATLLAATEGHPDRSARFRNLLGPLGVGDQLRAAFRLGQSTWAVADLIRLSPAIAFTAYDLARVIEVGTVVADRIAALATVASPAVTRPDTDSPGTALFDAAGVLCSLDDQAEQWFSELGGRNWSSQEAFTGMVTALVGHAHRPNRAIRPASARLRTPAGRWLVLTAAPQRSLGSGPPLTSLVVAPARPRHIAPLIVEAYHLTPREQQVTWAVARGLSNPEVATQLALSPHTVRDHLKTVFAKTEVTSRGELVAKLFTDQYDPTTLHDSTAHTEW